MGHVTHINIRHRFTQLVILVVAILACMLFSQTANAQFLGGIFDGKHKMDKPNYRVAVHKSSHKTCYVLFKKRNAKPSRAMFASNKRKRPVEMAETDEPARIAGAN